MTLKQKIQNLLTKANQTTGNADTNLTSAVKSLIDGYGGGGGVVVDYWTPSEDIPYGATATKKRIAYPASLDFVPAVIEIWREDSIPPATNLDTPLAMLGGIVTKYTQLRRGVDSAGRLSNSGYNDPTGANLQNTYFVLPFNGSTTLYQGGVRYVIKYYRGE